MNWHIGVDLGGTKIAAALVAPDGRTYGWRRHPTPVNAGPAAILEAISSTVDQLRRSVPEPGTVAGVGVATGGVVDPASGTILSANSLLPGWEGTPVGTILADRFHLPVTIENDVNAFAAGEHHFGAGQNSRSALYVTVGTGIGGALMIDGSILRGAHGSAGEIGHMPIAVANAPARRCNCGHAGHLEAFASGPAIVETYRRRAGRNAQTLEEVAELAATDPTAAAVIRDAGTLIGAALAAVMNVFDPARVVLGGGVIDGVGPLLWDALLAAVQDDCLALPALATVTKSVLGGRAGVVGAACLAASRTGPLPGEPAWGGPRR